MNVDTVIKNLREQGAPEATIQAMDRLLRPWMAMLDEGRAANRPPAELTTALANAVPLMVDLMVRMTAEDPHDMRKVWENFQAEFRETAETYSAQTMLALATRKGKLQ